MPVYQIDLMPGLREAAKENPDVTITDDGAIQLAPDADEATVKGPGFTL